MNIFGLIITTKKQQKKIISNEIDKYKKTIECQSTLSRKELEETNNLLKKELEDYENILWAKTLFSRFLKGE